MPALNLPTIRLRLILAAALICLLSATARGGVEALAATGERGDRPGSSTVMTNITADNMIYDSLALKVTFAGNVRVSHPDFTLKSDALQLFLTESASRGLSGGQDGLSSGALRKIIAESRVNITLPDGKSANCAKATYTVNEEIMLMEGNPVLREGNNQIRGDRMIFYLRENRNEVHGRVTMDFTSGEAQGQSGAGTGRSGAPNAR